ncbi:hypothetical protein [Meiothermus ruber]|uniref:Uncharacterized protein n=1 Tax=Meiothermus ruber (strain ATCC 35948 / DSM 1279 / VKM B-1258 / 21) TaxID=504728 RepID=D3PTC9_MEIRD|nr:hypothetical protein [Meiothermus ruber]ADD28712.1 hypothetical protein Mrub_1956 [Meiothermus ruber DSM 1279]AGK05841.1 hypothetical protein K649_12775 [Meiothermus ruber DSM 1279]
MAKNDTTAELRKLQTVEELAAEAGTPDWLLAAARVKHRWVVGQELTKAAFDRGIAEAANEPIGTGGGR